MPDLYIGKTFNPADRSLGERFMLDSSDLTTHGIVIGMTGSGKTGLSIGIIEELLKAKVPVIVIDPKGDMGNLALAFDRLAPEQFEPWVDKDDAAREGKSVPAVAAATAAMWTKGLGDWGITVDDVAAYAKGHTVKLFTPGASAGIPLNLIDSLDAPGGDFGENEEEYRDEIDSIVTALLGFIKVEADPISSREYILTFSLIENAWRNGQDLDLESLIGQVANPPIQKIGALPIDAFYPQKERNGLMFALNNLVASPPFQAWRQGDAIDIEEWVRPGDGLPQLSIISTAHLDDEQRIFVTALILNKLKTWMRKQSGTSELRCLFYMDEIFGYFPPTANPPTKKPLLTLLKQARAYGVGILLSTQNPVDLDYKGLGNMGFWAIGRLQTEQDQDRVKQGIASALADSDSGIDFETMIGGVQKRVFLVHDIHRKKPELVNSRWAMSYLRGPITRDEIRKLRGSDEPAGAEGAAESSATAAPRTRKRRGLGGAVANSIDAAREASAGKSGLPAMAPPLPAPFKAKFLSHGGGELAEPYVFVKAAVRYKVGGVSSDEMTRLLGFRMTAEMAIGELLEQDPLEIAGDLDTSGPAGLRFADLPAFVQMAGAKGIERQLKSRLDDRLQVEITFDPVTKKFAGFDEAPEDFALRLGAASNSSPKRDALELKIRKKQQDLAVKRRDASGRKAEKWATVGTSILGNIGIFSGRRKRVTGIGSVLSKSRMESTAEQRADALEAEINDLKSQLGEIQTVDPGRFEQRMVKPAATDVSIIRFDIVWVY